MKSSRAFRHMRDDKPVPFYGMNARKYFLVLKQRRIADETYVPEPGGRTAGRRRCFKIMILPYEKG